MRFSDWSTYGCSSDHAAREGIADERDPQRRRVQAISVLAFRFGGHFHRRRLLGGKGSECFGFCCLGLADLAIAALLRFCHVRRPSVRSSDTRIRPNAAGGPKRSLRSGHSEKDRDRSEEQQSELQSLMRI